MSKFLVHRCNFSRPDLTAEEKLVKVKGAFMCDEVRANEIIIYIENKQDFYVEENISRNVMGFGINCEFLSEELVEKLEQEKKDRENTQKEYELKLQAADKWFSSLGDDEKEYVKILGHTRFFVSAVG